MSESFFATLECELLERGRFASQAEAKMACFSFIDVAEELSPMQSPNAPT